MKVFGIRIKKELKKQEKKQIDLAKYLNVQKSTLSEWLNNNNEPPMKFIPLIAMFLNVTTDYLLGLESENNIKNTIKERIVSVIKEKGITAYKLSKDLRISKSVLHYWLTGETTPNAEYIVRLAKYFNVTSDYLLGLNDFKI